MNIYSLIPLAALIVYIPLLVSTLGARTWRRKRRLFSIFLASAIVWSLADYVFRGNFLPEYDNILIGIVIFLFSWTAIQFHVFISSFFPTDKSRWLPLACGSLVVTFILLITGYLPENLTYNGEYYYPQYGWLMMGLAIPLAALLLRNVYVLKGRLINQEDPVLYNQTFTLLLSLGILTVFALAAILPFGREFPVTHLGIMISSWILSYAVLGNHREDIRYMVRRGLILLITTLISLFGYWVLLYAFHNIFKVEFSVMSVASSSLAAIIAVAFTYRFRNTIARGLGKIFQGQTFYYRQKLMEFSGQIHNVFSLKDQGGELLALLARAIDCRKAALLFLDPGSEDFTAHLVEPKSSNNPLFSLRLKKDNPIVEFLNRERHMLTWENFQIHPEYLGLAPQEKSLLESNHIDLFLPLISREKLVGILVLDRRASGIYTLEDFNILEDVTGRVAVSMEKEYLRERLNEREQELSIINRSSAIIASSLDIQRIYDNFIKELKQVIDVDWASIAVIEEQELYFLALSTNISSHWRVGERIPLKGTATEWVASHRRAIVDSDLSVGAQFSTGKYHLQHDIRSIAYLPLTVSGNVIGTLIVASRQPDAYNQRHLKLLEQLASQIAMPIENSRLYAKTEHLARVDELTGLLNRRSLDEILPSEIGRHSRYGGVFSVVILDLDSFKSLNDTFGHLVGDDLLRQVGSIMKVTIREVDQAFRYGGDEFAIILPQTPTEAAEKVAERVRQQIAARVEIGTSPVTISLGLASWPADGITPNEIIAAADAALYTAKRSGGNRSHCSSGSMMSQATAVSQIAHGRDSGGALSNIYTLAATVDTRDTYTQSHSKKVQEYAMAIAASLGMSTLEKNQLGTCALLHDIGKIGINVEILNKKEKLNDQEWETIKSHPYLGASIASHSSQLSSCVSGILHHHERYDGSGYPDGLSGDRIPLESRILAIADSFAAMTLPRAYSREYSYSEAIEEIKKGSGSQYDPELVGIFLTVIQQVLASEKQDKIEVKNFELPD
jgi:diguanylate cyclase (GGDEF)-like protein/putative nucleotidyltransferase with HDIG domain